MGKLTDCTEASVVKAACAELGGSDRRILEGGCCSDQYYDLIQNSQEYENCMDMYSNKWNAMTEVEKTEIDAG